MSKCVGFFFELTESDQKSKLHSLRCEAASANEPKIISYLKSGIDAGVSMVIERDVLAHPPKVLGEAILKSDGQWIWPVSLAYFVETYHIKLPNDFILSMTENDWRVPPNIDFPPEVPKGHIGM